MTTAVFHFRPLKDKEILALEQTHSRYRELHEQPVDTSDAPVDTKLPAWRATPLMTDEEFMTELRQLCRPEFPLVSTNTVAKIYNLRARYEAIPPTTKGSLLPYKSASVRLQVKKAREDLERGKERTDQMLLPITREEEIAVFGEPSPRTNWFHLDDVIRHNLGRWPQERKVFPRKKLPPGRPAKTPEEKEAAQLQREMQRKKEAQRRKEQKAAHLEKRLAKLKKQLEGETTPQTATVQEG